VTITDQAAGYAEHFPLVRLLRRGSRRFNVELLVVIAVSGLSSASLLVIVNAAAEKASIAEASSWYLGLFAIVMAAYGFAQRHVLRTSVIEVERILDGIRTNIADGIRHADLVAMEHIGRARVYSGLTRETQTISQTAGVLMISCQSLLLVVFTTFYIAWLSQLAFLLAIAVTGLGIYVHLRHANDYRRLLQQATLQEHAFVESVGHLLDGFKEVKMSEPRSDDLYAHVRELSQRLSSTKIQAGESLVVHFVFAQAAFYLLIASMVFLLPRMAPTYSEIVIKATAAILFIIGPLSGVVSALPLFATANVAAQNIFDLEQAVTGAGAEPGASGARPKEAIGALELRQATFQYLDAVGAPLFTLGPIDLSVPEGQMLFVVGGNGSGKSTFLKVLTGLYAPHQGLVQMDGAAIGRGNAAWYRSHFSAVFSDYHLFDRAYGQRDVDAARVSELLRRVRLDDKTEYRDERFTNLDLSTGQRKRLALVVTLLEDRPILVFDEVAADQDPEFRRYFYESILTDLRRQGKTVVVATHDDAYFGFADRIIKLEDGRIAQDYQPPARESQA
jgi:putative ATP-binding cassette transporter